MQVEDILTRLSALEAEHHRVLQLQRKRRRFHVAAWIVVLGIGILGAMRAPEVPKVIEAESFVVRDPAGMARIELGMYEGAPEIVINDAKGNERTRTGLRPDDGEPYLHMRDDVGNPGMLLALSKARGAGFTLRAGKQADFIEFQSTDDQGAGVRIRKPDGEPIAALLTLKSGESWLSLRNSDRTGTATLSVGSDGKQALTLAELPFKPALSILSAPKTGVVLDMFAPGGKTSLVNLGVTKERPPMMILKDHTARSRVELGITPDDDRAGVTFNGPKTNARVVVAAQGDETAHVTIIDANENILFHAPDPQPVPVLPKP